MDSRKYCACNLTNGAILSSRISVVDAALEPLKVLEVLIGGLGLDSESSLWLTPLEHAPGLPRLFPYDLVYLDRDQRVIHAIEVHPGMDLLPFEGEISGALVLPDLTLSRTQTHPGDQLRICDDVEMDAQLQRIAHASGANQVSEISEPPVGQPVCRRIVIETAPLEVRRGIEPAYDQFPGHLFFMPPAPASDAISARSQVATLEAPPLVVLHVVAPEPASAPETVVIPEMEIVQSPIESPEFVSAAPQFLPVAESAAFPADVPEIPFVPSLLAATPGSPRIEAPGDESRRIQFVAGATPVPATQSVKTTLAQSSDWHLSSLTASVPTVRSPEVPPEEPQARPAPPRGSGSRLKAGSKGPAEQPRDLQEPAPATSVRTAQDKPPAVEPSSPLISALSAPVLQNPAHEGSAEPRPGSLTPASPPEPVEFLQSEDPLVAPGLPTSSNDAQAIEVPIIWSAQQTEREEPPHHELDAPHFFTPTHVSFSGPAEPSGESNATAFRVTVPDDSDLDTRHSTPLSPELRAVIQQISEKENQKQLEKSKPRKTSVPTVMAPEPVKAAPEAKVALPLPALPRTKAAPRIAGPLKESPKQKETLPAPTAPTWPKTSPPQTPSLGARIQHWLEAGPATIENWNITGRRRGARLHSPGLVAYYWCGGTPRPHQIVDISDSGFFLLTRDHWAPQTMLRMTLQRPDKKEGHPRHSLTVLAKVVRVTPDGVGHEFVMAEHLDRKSRDILPDMVTSRRALRQFLQPFN